MPDQTKDPIKEAFAKVKQDITDIKTQLSNLAEQLQEFKRTLESTTKPTTQQTIQPTHLPTQNLKNQTNQHITPTQNSIPTHKMLPYDPKAQDLTLSTRNEGVPTNKQTNQQTNQHIGNEGATRSEIAQVLESLDTMKREVRLKFKRLTEGEMAIFSLIYNLEEQGFIVDYPILATKLNLTEISIRDYIHKLIKKGIPIQKIKENNKKILLKIDPNLKKITTLQTIQTLREL